MARSFFFFSFLFLTKFILKYYHDMTRQLSGIKASARHQCRGFPLMFVSAPL